MARHDHDNPPNAPGEWFVDTRCIDCDTCRQVAPAVFADRRGLSVVAAQPSTPDVETSAWRASLACPTRSIGTRSVHRRPPDGLFPQELADGVYYCGHNDERSFGANAFFAVRPQGNVLVDAPRWTRRLARPIEALGGIRHILLTHRDDVADARRWADRFGARVWIHDADADAAPFATDVFDGLEPVEVQAGLVAVPVPGHTRGSAAFVLEERFMFSGDSLFWDRDRGDLAAHRHATWYSWSVQADSLARLADHHRFEWVLAGHGDRARRPADEMHDRLVRLSARMAR
jgi:glyoxylase-like metal-dependent hydrolase (beta-lactamase superfamily II)